MPNSDLMVNGKSAHIEIVHQSVPSCYHVGEIAMDVEESLLESLTISILQNSLRAALF